MIYDFSDLIFFCSCFTFCTYNEDCDGLLHYILINIEKENMHIPASPLFIYIFETLCYRVFVYKNNYMKHVISVYLCLLFFYVFPLQILP